MNSCSIRKHIWWLIPRELAGMPLPFINARRSTEGHPAVDAFDDDIKFLSEEGIQSIIGALDLPAHREVFQNCGFHYFSLQIPDGYPPTLEQVKQMLKFYDASPRPLAVHCEGGIGRTGTLLAIILVHRGLSASAAVRAVKTVMPPALEIREQAEFISKFEKHLKSRTASEVTGAPRKPKPLS